MIHREASVVAPLLAGQHGGTHRPSRIIGERLHEQPLSHPCAVQRAGHLAIERDPSCDAQITASRFLQGQTCKMERRFFKPLLHRERDVPMPLRDFLIGTAGYPEPIDELVAEEAAVAAAAVKHTIGIDAYSVLR